ncbi:cell wall-binding repeat-containing protein [Lagierella sp.]|uniref:cell wall-binding repeat-containing protein n=1 Tax=Lagierella sp. TaxID=2849657 RepID=UPI00262294B6|nr:cell wall-binding repeat-containing protein [Lagierella sp.]
MKKLIAILLSLSIFIGSFGNLGYAAEKNAVDNDYEKDERGFIIDETLKPLPDDDDVVEISDWNLKRGIVLLFGGTVDDVDDAVITKRMLRRIHRLSPEQCGAHDRKEIGIKVKDISELEYATNLEWFSAVYQIFTDLTPLKNANKMVHLDLRSLGTDENRVTDISPLKNMTELEFLNLSDAKIEDTSILSNFTKMKILNLSFTRIDNYDFASNMKDLEYIRSDFSPIRSLEPLRGLTKLKTILASAPKVDYTKPINENLIDSVEPLKDSTSLEEVDLGGHHVKDVSSLKGLVNLKKLVLTNNRIEDLEPLLALPKLEILWVQGNPGYPGYETSQYAYLEAKQIFNSLNKGSLNKEDIPTLEKLENASNQVKAFFNDDTLNTLMSYKEQLKTKDSVKNSAFEDINTSSTPEDPTPETPEEPKPEDPEDTGIKKIVEVIDQDEITIKKGEDISKLLPEMVKVKLAQGGIETKDEEPKIGTFRRNFRDGEEFGATSIAYKIVDENGNLLSSKDHLGMLKGVSQDEYKKEIYFNPVGDFYEYVTTGDDHFFNLEIVSDKYEMVGEYGFKQEYCTIYKDGTVRDVKANGEALSRHDANKEPEKFYVIHVKEKGQEPETPETPTENPKLGIAKDGKHQTITYKVVTTDGKVLSSKEYPGLISGYNMNPDYVKRAVSNGDYFTMKTDGVTEEYRVQLHSKDYELVGTYEFGMDYDQGTMGGKVTVVKNSNTTPTYYEVDDKEIPEEVFVIKVKPFGTEYPVDPAPVDPTPEEPTVKLGLGKDGNKETITYKVVTTDNKLVSAKDYPDLLKVTDVEGYGSVQKVTANEDYFTVTSNMEAYVFNITLNSQDYELVGRYSIENDSFGKISNITNSNFENDKYYVKNGEIPEEVFVIKVKPFGTEDPVDPTPVDTTPEEPTTGLGITKEGRNEVTTFKVVDENGDVVSAKDYPDLLKVTDEGGFGSNQKVTANKDYFTVTSSYEDYVFNISLNSQDYDIVGRYSIEYSDGGKVSNISNSNTKNGKYYVKNGDIPQEAFIIHVKTKGDNILSALEKLPVLFARTLNKLTAADDTMGLKVNWNLDNFKNEVGTYVLEGELVLPEGITNPQELKAKVTVNVVEDEKDPGDPTDNTETTEPSDSTDKPDTTEPVKPSPGVPSETEDSTEPTEVSKVETTRTKGNDRYETAIEISKKMYDKSEVVIVADGRNFPDSLTATVLAKYKNAPLLLSDEGKALDKVVEELTRLEAKEVIIVGGDSSVSTNEENRFKEIGKVSRIYGSDRYETSLKVAQIILKANPNQDTVIVADGRDYPDALAIAPVAARENMPIILYDGTGIGYAQSLLKEFSIKNSIIVGGKDSVDKTVDSQFEKSIRLAGADRYETAVKIARKYFENTKEMALVNGKDFPDALVVGVYAANNNMPVLLTRPEKLDRYVKAYMDDKDIEIVNIFGGKSSVAEDIIK